MLIKRIGSNISVFSKRYGLPENFNQLPLCQRSCRLDRIGTHGGAGRGDMARYGQKFKERVVARLLPPESSPVEAVSQTIGIGVATLERWRAEVLANPSGDAVRHWTPASRLEAVIATSRSRASAVATARTQTPTLRPASRCNAYCVCTLRSPPARWCRTYGDTDRCQVAPWLRPARRFNTGVMVSQRARCIVIQAGWPASFCYRAAIGN
jgi:hypothetical protein